MPLLSVMSGLPSAECVCEAYSTETRKHGTVGVSCDVSVESTLSLSSVLSPCFETQRTAYRVLDTKMQNAAILHTQLRSSNPRRVSPRQQEGGMARHHPSRRLPLPISSPLRRRPEAHAIVTHEAWCRHAHVHEGGAARFTAALLNYAITRDRCDAVLAFTMD